LFKFRSRANNIKIFITYISLEKSFRLPNNEHKFTRARKPKERGEDLYMICPHINSIWKPGIGCAVEF